VCYSEFHFPRLDDRDISTHLEESVGGELDEVLLGGEDENKVLIRKQ
jgi:hypothetical protein